LPVKSWEKHRIHRTTVPIKRLGKQKIQVATANRDKELQQELCIAIRNTGYVKEAQRTKCGNLIFRLVPTRERSFSELIEEVVTLIVRRIESYKKKRQYEERHDQKTVSPQAYTAHQAKKHAKRTPKYRLPAGRVITT
jgi:hypothetical protein